MTTDTPNYSQIAEAHRILASLLADPKLPIPEEARKLAAERVSLYLPKPPKSSEIRNPILPDVILPVPLKETETVTALKAIEGSVANAIGKLRFGPEFVSDIRIDLQHALMFLFMAYIASVDGFTKADKEEVKKYLRDTDLFAAQSNTYRRMSANLYKTKDGRYYHIHGSLEATKTLNMIGLPGFDPNLTDYAEIVAKIQAAVAQFTADELEEMNLKYKQAGVEALTPEQFRETRHGKAMLAEPYWTVEQTESLTPPAEWRGKAGEKEKLGNSVTTNGESSVTTNGESASTNGNSVTTNGESSEPSALDSSASASASASASEPSVPSASASASASAPQILSGIKVLELCRIIAGPTITRILAEYGAEVLKITGPNLPDVPFFQVDGNMGKHCAELDLKNPEDRAVFESLLAEADVLVDGFRTHAIEKLGYGPQKLAELATKRGRGFVYVSENCFGFTGDWSFRAGWQQIADCVTGVAWEQGKALGLNEPMVPPFPMSDYGTGCMGAIAAMVGLYKRAIHGGSYWAKTSLVQYDLLLLAQGKYDEKLWEKTLSVQDPEVLKLRYFDSVDKISGTVLRSMKELRPDFFGEGQENEGKEYMEEHFAPSFGAKIKVLKPVVEASKTRNGFNEVSRVNGYDKAEWFM